VGGCDLLRNYFVKTFRVVNKGVALVIAFAEIIVLMNFSFLSTKFAHFLRFGFLCIFFFKTSCESFHFVPIIRIVRIKATQIRFSLFKSYQLL